MSDDSTVDFFRKLPGSRKGGETAVTTFVVEPCGMPPVLSTSLSWSPLIAARFKEIAEAGAAGGELQGKSLPYASLRAAFQVALPEAVMLESDLGRPWKREGGGPFLRLIGNIADDGAQRASRALKAWIALILRRWAERAQVAENLIDLVASAAAPGEAFVTEISAPDISRSISQGEPFDRLRHPILQEISHRLEGLELFPGLGPVRRIVRARHKGNSVEFQTWPAMAPKGGLYSMTALLTVGTIPYLSKPVVTVRASRRRWLDDAPNPERLRRQNALHCYLMGRDGPPIAVEFEAQLISGVPIDPFTPDFMIQAMRLRADIALPLPELVRQRSDGVFLGIPYAPSRDGKHKVGSGGSTRDQIDLFDAVSVPLAEAGFRPLPFREVRSTSPREDEFHKAMGADALVADFALSLGHNELNEENLLETARTLFEDGDPEGFSPSAAAAARTTLDGIRAANRDRIQRAFGDFRPVVVAVASRERDRRLMAAAVRGMFGGAVDVEERPLPTGVHGPRSDLPQANSPAKERFAARVLAWSDLSADLSRSFGGCHVLVQAADWYGKKPDDGVNKVAGRFALATKGGCNVQYLLPCENWKGFEAYLHRIRSAVYDLLFGHSALVSEVRSLLKADFPDPVSRPRAIIGLSVVTQARIRGGGAGGQIALATRIDGETSRTTARVGWHDNGMRWSPVWEPFFDAMKRIANLEAARLGATADAARNSFQDFAETVIDEAVDAGEKPLVLIDATSTTGMWPWLADSRIGGPAFIGIQGSGKAEHWASARLVRVRRDLAGRIIERKTVSYARLDPATGAACETVERFSPTVIPKTLVLSEVDGGTARHYAATSGYTQQFVRGLSVYRDLPTFTSPGPRIQVPEAVARKGATIRSAFGVYDAPYPVPNPIEITVAHVCTGDDPDLVAHLVNCLRQGYGHTDAGTVLPAPLSFESKARDYMARFTIDEMDEEPDQDAPSDRGGGGLSPTSEETAEAALSADQDMASSEMADHIADGDVTKDSGGEELNNALPVEDERLPVPGFVTREWIAPKMSFTPAMIRQAHDWRQEIRDAAGFPWPVAKPSPDEAIDLVIEGLAYPNFIRALSRVLVRLLPPGRKRDEFNLFGPFRKSLNGVVQAAEKIRWRQQRGPRPSDRPEIEGPGLEMSLKLLRDDARHADVMALIYFVSLGLGFRPSFMDFARTHEEDYANLIPFLERASDLLNGGFNWQREIVEQPTIRLFPPEPRDDEISMNQYHVSVDAPEAVGETQAKASGDALAIAKTLETLDQALPAATLDAASQTITVPEMSQNMAQDTLDSSNVGTAAADPLAPIELSTLLQPAELTSCAPAVVDLVPRPQAEASGSDAEMAMARWQAACSHIVSLATDGMSSDPDVAIIESISRAAREAKQAQNEWEAARPRLVDAWPIVMALRSVLERLSALDGAPDMSDLVLISVGPVLVSAAVAEGASVAAQQAEKSLVAASARVEENKEMVSAILRSGKLHRLGEAASAQVECERRIRAVSTEIVAANDMLISAQEETAAAFGAVKLSPEMSDAPRALAPLVAARMEPRLEEPAPAASSLQPANDAGYTTLPVATPALVATPAPVVAPAREHLEVRVDSGQTPEVVFRTVAEERDLQVAYDPDLELPEAFESDDVAPLPIDITALPEMSPAPAPIQSDPLAGRIRERLDGFAEARRFGLGYHLARAAQRLMPNEDFGWSSHEFRLVAMTGHVAHASMQGSQLLDEMVTGAIEAVEAMTEGVSVRKADSAAARRIFLGGACAEIALFHPTMLATQGLRALGEASPEIGDGCHDLIEALSQVAPGLVTPALLRTVSREAEGSRYSDRCVEAILANIEHFSKIKFGYQPAARIRNTMHMREGVVGRLRDRIGRGPEVATVAAREFLDECGDRDRMLAALERADEKSARFRGLDGIARERMLSALNDLLRLTAEYLAAADAVPSAQDSNRKARVQAIAQSVAAGARRAATTLAVFQESAGPLAAAASSFTIAALDSLASKAEGTFIQVGLHDHMLAVHGDLLWIPGLHFGRGWLPSPYAPGQVVSVLMEHGLGEYVGSPAEFESAVRARMSEGSFIAARLLIEAGGFFSINEERRGVLIDLWTHDSRLALADLTGDDTHIGKLEECRRLVEKLQRMGGMVNIDQAQGLIAKVDCIDTALIPSHVPLEARGEEEEGEQVLDVCTALEVIQNVSEAIQSQLAVPKATLCERLEEAHRNGAASDDVERVRRIIEDDEDLLTAGEYISFLESGNGLPEHISPNRRHDAFAKKVPDAVDRMQKRGLELARRALEAGANIDALPFSRVAPERRAEALELLSEWREIRRQAEGPANTQHMAALLSTFLGHAGISATILRIENKTGMGLRKIHVSEMRLVIPTDAESVLLPDFGSGTGGNYRVCLMTRSPSEPDLAEICKQESENYGVVVFVTAALTAEQRNQLAAASIERNRRILVIDEAIFLYALSEEAFRPLTLFELAQPYSFADPYRDFGNEAVSREMFFGRSVEIRKIMDRNGSCIVYGGRRLGKTALLKHVQNLFHAPDSTGTAVGYAGIYNVGGTELASKVWEYASAALPAIFPQTVATATQFVDAVTRWLDGDRRRRVLLMLDEADAFISSDGEHSYQEFLRLQALMDRSGRLFKVVFAGLHNVTRLAHTDNPPLKHIAADPLRIGPLMDDELEEAERLVTQPLGAMGYRFKNRSDVWRILSHCNYYPVLVQTFCKGLLEILSKQVAQLRRPIREITERHIREALDSRDIRREIGGKFEATIKIDGRYELISCVMANRALEDQAAGRDGEGMTAVEVLDAASTYWSAAFAHTGKLDAVKDLLDEMEGLGVLRLTVTGRWTLRSNAILRLLGDRDHVESRLLDFVGREAPAPFEPRTMRRPLRAPTSHRGTGKVQDGNHCPLTLGQEHDLFLGDARMGVLFGSPVSDIGLVSEALRSAEPIGPNGTPIKVTARTFRNLADLLDTVREQAKLGQASLVVDPRSEWDLTWIEQTARHRSIKDGKVRLVFIGEPRHALSWVREPRSLKLPPLVRVMTLQPWSDALIKHELKRDSLPEEPLLLKLRRLTGGFNRPMSQAVQHGGTAERFEGRIERMAERLHKDAGLMGDLGVIAPMEGLFRAMGVWTDADTGRITLKEIADYVLQDVGDTADMTAFQVAEFGVLMALLEPEPLRQQDETDQRGYTLSPLLRTALAQARPKEAA